MGSVIDFWRDAFPLLRVQPIFPDNISREIEQYIQSEPDEFRLPEIVNRMTNYFESGALEIVASLASVWIEWVLNGWPGRFLSPEADRSLGLLTTRWLGCNPLTNGHREWMERVFIRRSFAWQDILLSNGDARRATEINARVPRSIDGFLGFASQVREREFDNPVLRQDWELPDQDSVAFRILPFRPAALKLFTWWARISAIQTVDLQAQQLAVDFGEFMSYFGDDSRAL